MATLSSCGRISVEAVDEEIARLKKSWRSDRKREAPMKLTRILNEEQLSGLDLFDRMQLEQVVELCARTRSLSEAGRLLFNQSRSLRSTPNDLESTSLIRIGLGIHFCRLRHK
jgi:transcriptional regulatory protein RtcR